MIHVIATITVNPGTRSAVLDEFKRITPLVRAEDGCIEYQAAVDVLTSLASQDPPRPDVVTVVEKWASLEALHAHTKAAHMVEYRDRVKDLVKSVKLQILEPV